MTWSFLLCLSGVRLGPERSLETNPSEELHNKEMNAESSKFESFSTKWVTSHDADPA
jgi:hypothetical protein